MIGGSSSSLPVVFFETRGLRCALPVSAVREVLPMPNLTPVPLAPPVLRGIAPIRGQILPVIDLGPCLQQASSSTHRLDAERLLVLEAALAGAARSVQAGLAVESTVRVGAVDERHSRPAPARPPFVSATIMDAAGPALLIDASRAMDFVRDALSAVATS
jgi:chemotaxis signal transduction protein